MSLSQYDAHAFHESFPKGKSSGRLSVSAGAIEFSGGGQSCRMALSRLHLKLGGASDRLVYISDASQPDWVLYTSDRAILKDPHLQTHPELFQQMKSARQKRAGNWSVLAVVALLCVLSPVLLYLSMDSLASVAANQVPPEWEESLGKTVFAQYSVDYDMMTDKQVEEILLPITAKLTSAIVESPYAYKIHIVNDESINAFALPGGYIVIHSGLILKAANAEEVLGVLAHEISHVTEKHGLRNVISALGTYLMVDLLLGDATGLLAMAGDAAPILINQSYSRDFEREADRIGFDLLNRAQINPVGMRDFFYKIQQEEQQRLEKVEDDNTRELMQAASSILSTHPATQERIEYIQQLIDEGRKGLYANAEYRQFDSDFTRLQDQVALFVTETSADDLDEAQSSAESESESESE
jgi:predicted Zn-dependent protease